MRFSVTVCFVFLALIHAPSDAAETSVSRAIDPHASKASFSVTHAFVETVTGAVPIAGGTVALQPGTNVPTSIHAVLDPTRIKTGEDDRDGALQTADWFDTKRFPTWTFESTRVTSDANGAMRVDGMLTMHGVSANERLEVTMSGDAQHPRYHAVTHIDRHAFGMNVTRLDPVIGNDVTVTLDVALR